MKARSVQGWLDRKLLVDSRLCLLAAGLLVPLGLLACFVEFWVLYGLLWLFLRALFEPWMLMVLAGGTLVALGFWQTKIRPEPLAGIRFESRNGERHRLHVPARTGIGVEVVFTGPDAERLSLGHLRNLLLGGPRLLLGSLDLWRAAQRHRTFDRTVLARTLGLLVEAEGKIPFSVLRDEMPEADLEQLVSQLRMIDGVVFLKNAPPGLSVARYLLDDMHDWQTASAAK